MECFRGILVGCDQNQEWLLSWWWDNYRQENSLPVAFADFGMSEEGKAWCREHGILLPTNTDGLKVATRDEINPALIVEWENFSDFFWKVRQAWMKKPFACLCSPFSQTLWIDLDCEVLGNLAKIYDYIDPHSKMGLVQVNTGTEFNSGVIVFEKDSPLLKKWTEATLSKNHQFVSDQGILSQVIFECSYSVGEIPEIYNWPMCRGYHLGTVVLHWAAEWGKAYIQKHGGLRKELQKLFYQ